MTSATENSARTEQPTSPFRDSEPSVKQQEQSAQLQKKSLRGMAISLPAQGLKAVIYLASIMILSRMLPPEDFGVMSMVLVVTGFLDLFKDLGLSAAIVQREKLSPGLVGCLLFIVILVSAVLAGIVFASGPTLSWFYRESRITELTPLLGLAVFAGGLGMIPQALSRRNLYFGRLAVIDVLSPAIGLIVAVIAIQQGYGVRSLALQTLISVSVASTLYWCVTPTWPGYPRWNSDARDALFFGGNLSGFAFTNYFARNLDNLLIGRYWGGSALGIYSRAYAVLLAPIQLVNAPLNTVFVSILSRVQTEPDEVRRHYLRGLKVATSITLPLSAILVTCPHEITRIMLGSGWGDVADVIRLLAIGAPGQFIGNTAGWLYISLNRTNRMFRWGIFGTSLLVLSFLIGLPFGAKGVALSYSIMMLLQTVLNLWYATRDTIITIKDIFWASLPATVNAICLGVILTLLNTMESNPSDLFSAVIVLLVGTVGVMASVLVCLLKLRNAQHAETRNNLPKTFPGTMSSVPRTPGS